MIVVALVPGPAVITITSASLTGGFKRGLYLTIGVIIADYIFILFAISGLAIVAETMGTTFIYIQYLCSIYLIWFGISLWFSSNTLQNKRQKSIVRYHVRIYVNY
ncbi:LysE family transporter [Thalassotalea ponticola]|uniref:LysE family translocator n=1 Tax=Thalassotalea ponticola TaxID=1523392 RepID=UPI00338EDE0A